MYKERRGVRVVNTKTDIILSSGFDETGVIPTKALHYYEDVRKMCEDNVCRCYGTTWACPPATGTIEECRERISAYEHMQLFSKIYPLEDPMDFEAMMEAMHDFKDCVDVLAGELGGIFILSNESCDRCRICTYPDAPCRFPEKLHHSIEGYGLMISELAEQAGINYINGQGTVTFFGAVLYSDSHVGIRS